MGPRVVGSAPPREGSPGSGATTETSFPAWQLQVFHWRLIASSFWTFLIVSALFCFAHLLPLLNSFSSSTLFAFFPWATFFFALLLHHFFLRSCMTVKRQVYTLPHYIWENKGQLLFALVCVGCTMAMTYSSIALQGVHVYHWQYVWTCGAVLGVVHWSMIASSGLFTLSFPSLQQGRIVRFKAVLGNIILNAFCTGLVVAVTVAVLYIGFISWSSHNSGFGQHLRHGEKNNIANIISLIIPQIYANTLVVLAWGISHQIMVIINTQAISFKNGDKWDRLFNGIQSKDPLIQHLAFIDLATKIQHFPSLRSAIFRDSSGELWQQVAFSCCSIIDVNTKKLEDAVASIQKQGSKRESLPQRVKTFFRLRLTQEATTNNLFVDSALVSWSALAISNLCAASRGEDKFGVVQTHQGLMGVLCTLLAQHAALNQFMALSPARGANTVPRIDAQAHALVSVMESSIYGIVTTFYEDLATLRFPARYRAVLQGFVDFVQ